MPRRPQPEDSGPEPFSLEDLAAFLKDVPNDLGGIRYPGIPSTDGGQSPDTPAPTVVNLDIEGGIPPFSNDDLDVGRFTQDEVLAIARMLPEPGLFQFTAIQLADMALARMDRLAAVVRALSQMREHIETLGGDTHQDLVGSILSAVGEMARLRTIVPKLQAADVVHDEDEPADEGES